MTGQATDMAGMVAGLGSQLRWATELEVDRLERPPAVIVAGMGGSGISGDMAAPLADEAGSLLVVHKGYGLARMGRLCQAVGGRCLLLGSDRGDVVRRRFSQK